MIILKVRRQTFITFLLDLIFEKFFDSSLLEIIPDLSPEIQFFFRILEVNFQKL